MQAERQQRKRGITAAQLIYTPLFLCKEGKEEGDEETLQGGEEGDEETEKEKNRPAGICAVPITWLRQREARRVKRTSAARHKTQCCIGVLCCSSRVSL